jgi:DNA-binding MarR family transcriptional regulator
MVRRMLDHKQTLAYVSAHLSRLLANRMRDALAPIGLLPAQFTAIAEIAQDEGLSQKQLVERLDLEQPGVARTLATLEKEGWIARHSANGVQGLHLTQKARDVLPRALGAIAALDREATAEFTRTEREHLLDTLDEAVAVNRRRG